MLFKEKKYKPVLYLQQSGNTLILNQQLFCQQIELFW